MADFVLREWPTDAITRKVSKFLHLLDGRVWQVEMADYGYTDPKVFRNAIAQTARNHGYTVRTGRVPKHPTKIVVQVGTE